MSIITGSRKQFVLVVDSDCHGGRSLLSELRSLGCYVSLASSGTEALQYVEDNEPDAVVADWNLPDMSGLELARRIKSMRFATKVVLEKEGADWRSLRQTLEVGGEELLSRPVSAATVLRRLEHSALPQLSESPGDPLEHLRGAHSRESDAGRSLPSVSR
jgi:CheY-like chemotaxis protein